MYKYSVTAHAGASLDTSYMPANHHTRDIPFLDGVSSWNTRVLLISGEAVLTNYRTGDVVPGFIPDGHLICLFPWAPDQTESTEPNQTARFWRTPTLLQPCVGTIETYLF